MSKKQTDLHSIVEEAQKKMGFEAAEIIAKDLSLEDWNGKKARCPFHSDDTPSFIFNEEGSFFKCFGCGRVYGIIDHYVEFEGLAYQQAVKKLCESQGYEYKEPSKSKDDYFKGYKYPREETNTIRDKAEKYLAKRHISARTLDFAGIKECNNGNIVFEYRDIDNTLLCCKYRVARAVKKGENKMWLQQGSSNCPSLFLKQKVNPAQPLVLAEGECFPGDVEVLTPNGWIRLDRYGGELVMQVDESMKGEFVSPRGYVHKRYRGDLLRVDKGGNYTTITTPQHNLVYVDRNKRIVKRPVEEMPVAICGYIPTTINFDGCGIGLSKDQISLCLAVSADATIDYRKWSNERYARMSFTKERKAERIRGLLDRLGVEYSDNEVACKQQSICFTLPEWCIEKLIPYSWATKSTYDEKRHIIEEMVVWDGNAVLNRRQYEYSSKVLHNAIVMQTIAHTCGYMSTIIPRSNEHGSWYKVSVLLNKKGVSWQGTTPTKISHDGYVYCVTVPTGMILVRQNGHISVSGNCDALAIIEAGYNNVVSVPYGAGNYNWIEFNYDFLEQFDKLILWFDNDEAGAKALKEISPRLGLHRTYYVSPPSDILNKLDETFKSKAISSNKCDANNVLIACGKNDVLWLINNAKENENNDLTYLLDYDEIDVQSMEKFPSNIEAFDEVLFGTLMNTLTIVTGKPGSGKSVLVNQLGIHSAIQAGYKAMVFSGELKAEFLSGWVLRPFAGREHILEWKNSGKPSGYSVTHQAKDEIKKMYRDNIITYKKQSKGFSTKPEDIYNAIEYSYKKYGTRVFTLDNLMCLSFGFGDRMYDEQRQFVGELIDLVERLPIAIILAVHTTKDDMNVSGASEILRMAHRCIYDKRLEDNEMGYNALLEVWKERIVGGTAGKKINLYYDVPSMRLYTNDRDLNFKYSWESGFDSHYTKEVIEQIVANKKDERSEVFGGEDG